MSWLQLALIASREQVPRIEAVLENAGALAITLDDPAASGDAADPADISLLEPAPGATPLWALVRVTALFENNLDGRVDAELASAAVTEAIAAPPQLDHLADQVWERAWLEHWRPLRFGRRLWVCPHDQDPQDDPDAVVIRLDPGLAFGTGSHPTTALCLEWLDGVDLAGKTVIDYGCGSGILAIAALKLGAARAIAIDYDPQALAATVANAAANGVSERLSCQPPEASLESPADVLVANILAGVLVKLAPKLCVLCREQGSIVLSGILEPQIPSVRAAYAGAVSFSQLDVRNQWALLSGARIGAVPVPVPTPVPVLAPPTETR